LTLRAQRKSAEDTEKRNPRGQAEACATGRKEGDGDAVCYGAGGGVGL
jgi:hypothetical protein